MESGFSISVIIITRNRDEWLKDTLLSLTKQSRKPDEVIVVDNDSKDNTKEATLSFNNRLNIKYIYETIRGRPYARSTGIKNATGDIVAFIDDDCVADENWLKYIEAPFIRDSSIGVVGGELSYFKIGNGAVETFYMKNMISRGRSK